jgi:hypothetical protein
MRTACGVVWRPAPPGIWLNMMPLPLQRQGGQTSTPGPRTEVGNKTLEEPPMAARRLLYCRRVNARGRLVQDQDARVGQPSALSQA